jgi:hypothetical protein
MQHQRLKIHPAIVIRQRCIWQTILVPEPMPSNARHERSASQVHPSRQMRASPAAPIRVTWGLVPGKGGLPQAENRPLGSADSPSGLTLVLAWLSVSWGAGSR